MPRRLTLHRRCRELAQQVSLPRPFSIETFRDHVAAQRGRPLHLHPLPLEAASAGACGLWLATATDDHIFYEPHTSTLHQEHIVLHEFGHMLFDHHPVTQDTGRGGRDDLSSVLPDLDPRLVRRLLGRTNYSTSQEREAELLASLLRTHADRPSRRERHGPLASLGAALGVRDPEC
ncbi:hypothetical protein [Streptomyces purpureus]|uniref:Regulator component n=1 Tax=Streptomyces purpureus TaxID=1951 RepID=A0A918HGK5_9ACTN|nr:hypothetical protein [Streptomyces purpureus]GGT60393.1 hypothetical protein GCM10014713_62280 [Streptomyces purpureus]